MELSIEDHLRDLLSNLSANIRIMEHQIDIHTQHAYFKQSSKTKIGKKTEKKTIADAKKILILEADEKAAKKLIPLLAQFGSIETLRVLEKFRDISLNHDLKNWTTMAIEECKMAVESDLLDENQIFISSGLGGRGNKLRYFCVVVAQKENFTEYQHKIILSEFETACKYRQAELEKVDLHANYASLTLLAPINIAVADVLDQGIAYCNELGNFVLNHYLVTNVGIPPVTMIETYVEQMQNKR